MANVYVLYTFGNSTWRLATLPKTRTGYTTTLPIPPNTHDLEYLVQAVDDHGNVAISNDKGKNYHQPLNTPTTTTPLSR